MTAFRGILRYMWMGPCHWAATVISFVIVPFIVPFAKDGYLPSWLSWFQTADNSLDGDNGWQTEHRPWLDIPYDQLSGFQRYISRVLWLYRNPVRGFEISVLRAVIDPSTTIVIKGDAGVGDRYSVPPYKTGWGYAYAQNGNGQCYVELFWFFKLSGTRSFNGMIGWKLTQVPQPITQTYNIQICTTIRSTKIFA